MKIRLNLTLFLASLVALFLGAPILGLAGVWGFYVKGMPVPHFLKILHAHTAWWSLVLLLSSLIISSVNLKPFIKRIIIYSSFFIFPLYALFITLHYTSNPSIINLGTFGRFFVTPYGFLAFLLEFLFFAQMLILIFLAGGLKISFLQQKEEVLGKDEIESDVYVPRKVFLVYGIFLFISVLAGLFILSNFTLQHKPVSPAALTQLHTHTGIFSVGFMMVMLAMSALGVNIEKLNFFFRFGTLSLLGTVIGLLIFILFKTHSIVWVLPSGLYFIFLIFGWLSLFGKFGLKVPSDNNYFHYLRWCLIVIWGALLIYTSAGAYLALRYDVSSDLTVTYKQQGGCIEGKHVGPYPDVENYQGTAPVKHNPRGLENFHLSPGSWSHVAILWLLILLIFGKEIFQTIKAPNLLFALGVTIVQAPIINSIGRIGAWLDLPGGIGPLFLVAQPLKTLNILSLIVITILFLSIKSKNK